jgi:hypothetical protein
MAKATEAAIRKKHGRRKVFIAGHLITIGAPAAPNPAWELTSNERNRERATPESHKSRRIGVHAIILKIKLAWTDFCIGYDFKENLEAPESA